MRHHSKFVTNSVESRVLLFGILSLIPALALGQADPFITGTTALQNAIFTWLTPIAIILVMVLGGLAMAGRMSWGWCIGVVLGIVIAFGAPTIVAWIRAMFAV